MDPVLTAAQMAQLDAYTIQSGKADGRTLMGNAGREVLSVIRERWPDARRIVVLAGTGNNGGDGFALALDAHQQGIAARVLICSPAPPETAQWSPDARHYFDQCHHSGVPIEHLAEPGGVEAKVSSENADIAVDAIFGTGLNRRLGEYFIALIDRLNSCGQVPVLAVDCPSGLDCTTGLTYGAAMRASGTVTFGYRKLGFFHPAARQFTWQLKVVDIGLAAPSNAGIGPAGMYSPEALWGPLRLPRLADTHKGDYGKLLVVAGHRRYPGAPRLCAQAAVRMGAGLTRLVVPEPIYTACCDDPAVMTDWHPSTAEGGFTATPSAELLEYLDWADALVIGPGMHDGPARELAVELISRRDIPTVVDADALPAALTAAPRERWPLVLTPHPGELARLTGMGIEKVFANWFDLPRAVAQKLGAFVLAKSSQSLLAAPGGQLYFPRTGHPALAKGGTGDVLAGMLGALLARLHASSPDGDAAQMAEIALTAVNLHSAAARLVADEVGENSLTPSVLVETLPKALQHIIDEC